MIVVNDFPYIANEEFLMLKQPSPSNSDPSHAEGIILTKKQTLDLLEFLDSIREAL